MDVKEIQQALEEVLSGKLSDYETIAKGRQVIEAMTDNPAFPNPEPPLEKLSAAFDAFERACRDSEFAEYQERVSERKLREAENVLLELMKNQPRH